jgi:transcriptional regulator with XRE-family HTH domain
MDDARTIGTRIREIRTWRRKSLRVVAGLAGISAGYLSRVERGERAVDRRSLVEAIAGALQVAPSELLAEPGPARDPIAGQAHAAIEQIGMVLAHNRLDHPYSDQPRPWPEVHAELQRFTGALVPACDYVGQAVMLPTLIEALYTVHATDPAHRREALIGLMLTLQHTAALLKNLGAHGMPHLAAMHMRYVADELDDPAWIGAAEWRVGQSSGGDRSRMLAVSLRAAEQLQADADPRARQAYGMLHLNAALATAAMRRPADSRAHLAEAHDVLDVTAGAADFADMHFNRANWTTWRVAVGVELGEGPAVTEHTRNMDVASLPVAERRAMFYGDLGRGLAQDKATRERAVLMLRAAEDAAPQRIRTNPYIRETVIDLVRQAKRDATGRELRGMAYRMGIAG